MKYNYIKYFAVLTLGLVACEPEFDNPLEDTPVEAQSSGEANFSNYVAIGNSLTAGFADGALYIDGQNTAFPNLLAQQMEAAGGTSDFRIPLMNDNIGGFAEANLGQEPRFKFDFATQRPVRIEDTPTTSITTKLSGQFNNMGVPGAKSFHLLAPGYGNPAGLATEPASANPYFVRFASSPQTTVIEDVLAQQPTFFSLWIGNNDVLGFATSGGVGELQPAPTTTDPRMIPPPGENDISNPGYFQIIYTGLINALTVNPETQQPITNRKGILAGIPSVTNSPFFTTVPYNPIPLDQATADAINAANNKVPASPDESPGYNVALLGLLQAGQLSQEEVAKRTLNFSAGQNPVIIVDENLTAIPNLPPLRQTTPEDLLILRASSFIGTPNEDDNTKINGISAPLADQWVLTPEEQELIAIATTAYNNIIKNLADAGGLAYFDANARLTELQETGIPTGDGGVATGDLSLTSAFSLDGIHLNPRGNAIIANSMIDAINEKYGSTLQKVDPSLYKTITIR